MPSLISHRSTAYLDNEELERAAGLMEIEAKSEDVPQFWRDLCAGAACALRILHDHDLRTAEDFKRVFDGATYIPD